MKKNESGFSTTVILLVLVAVGLIAGIGWYVWRTNNSKTPTPAPTVDTVTEESKKQNEIVSQDFAVYDDVNLALLYPQKWLQQKYTDQPEWVFFRSEDYKPATALGPSVEAGYQLEVRVSPTADNENYEQDLKNSSEGQEAHGGTYETIEIDGHKAVLSNIKPHGTYWHTQTYYNGKTYFFRLSALDENKPEVKELFKAILATVKLK